MTDNSRVAELTRALENKSQFIQDGINSDQVKVEGENVHVPEEVENELKTALKEYNEIKWALTAANLGMETKDFIHEMQNMGVSANGKDGGPSAAMRAAAGLAFGGGEEAKSLGEAFVKSEEFKALKNSGRLTMDTPFEIEGQQDVTRLGTYGQKDVYAGMDGAQHTISHGFGRIQFDPTVPRAQRPTRVRDLFPVATTNANLIDYFRVLGFVEQSGEGAAGPVRDRAAGADGTSAPTGTGDVFGLKPKSNLRFESAQAPVRTLAHWEAAHRNVLADEPQLQSTINNELLYGLALEEDNQILNGDGTNENLLGLLNTPNTQQYTQPSGGTPAVASELKSDSLRRAATLAVIANYPPTGFVLHPYDWEDIELQKGSTANGGDGQYMLFTNISIGAASQVWRQPVVETPAMPEGTFVTGAWGIGAQLYDRMQANVRIAEQHADFFVRNAVAILVEERLAFAVKRPESFVEGHFFTG
jgi:Phage capsid family